jgi:hypothetical protein
MCLWDTTSRLQEIGYIGFISQKKRNSHLRRRKNLKTPTESLFHMFEKFGVMN